LGPGIIAASGSSTIAGVAVVRVDPVEGMEEVERKVTVGTLAMATLAPALGVEVEIERILLPLPPTLEYPEGEVLLKVAEEV
jgi:hypothetical protein